MASPDGAKKAETPGAIYDSTHAFERKSSTKAKLSYNDSTEASAALQKLIDDEDLAQNALVRMPVVRRALRQRVQTTMQALARL